MGKDGADFWKVKFSSKGRVDFGKTQFLGPGKVRFEKTSFNESAPVLFDRMVMDTSEILQFVDVSTFGSALFLYTDVERIGFKNVHFRKTRNRFFNREKIADEDRNDIVVNKDDKVKYNRDYYNQVEILYHQLKVNFENQRDYSRAGDFHYGELEMQRKRKMLEWEEKPISRFLPFLKFFNLRQYYKIVSGYGEKWPQALASFIGVLLLCTGLNFFWVEPKVTLLSETARIEKWEKDSLHRLGGTALFSFKVLTLQKWEHDFQLKGSSYWPKFFVSAQHLIGPGIIALMLLAIRRKFRR